MPKQDSMEIYIYIYYTPQLGRKAKRSAQDTAALVTTTNGGNAIIKAVLSFSFVTIFQSAGLMVI